MTKINISDMPPFEICLLIMDMKGSLREVANKIGRSRAYVSIMRKIAKDASTTLLNSWQQGEIPFDLVREIITTTPRQQMDLVRNYVNATRGRNKQARGLARAALFVELKRLKGVTAS